MATHKKNFVTLHLSLLMHLFIHRPPLFKKTTNSYVTLTLLIN